MAYLMNYESGLTCLRFKPYNISVGRKVLFFQVLTPRPIMKMELPKPHLRVVLHPLTTTNFPAPRPPTANFNTNCSKNLSFTIYCK